LFRSGLIVQDEISQLKVISLAQKQVRPIPASSKGKYRLNLPIADPYFRQQVKETQQLAKISCMDRCDDGQMESFLQNAFDSLKDTTE
jgi:hypothetical protein